MIPDWKYGWWERFIDGLNCVSINVWMFLVIIIGTIITLKGEVAVGSSLITGAFAIFSGRRPQDKRAVDDKVEKVIESKLDDTIKH